MELPAEAFTNILFSSGTTGILISIASILSCSLILCTGVKVFSKFRDRLKLFYGSTVNVYVHYSLSWKERGTLSTLSIISYLIIRGPFLLSPIFTEEFFMIITGKDFQYFSSVLVEFISSIGMRIM